MFSFPTWTEMSWSERRSSAGQLPVCHNRRVTSSANSRTSTGR